MNETKKKPFTPQNIKKAASKDKHNAPCKCNENVISKSEGEIVIAVVRLSYNIPAALPYCVWGTLYINNNSFATVLQPYLPPGVTVTTFFDTNILFFQYTLGALTDIIIVTTPPQAVISYSETLYNLNTNFLRSNFMLMNFNANTDGVVMTDNQVSTLQVQNLYLQKMTGSRNKDVQAILPYSRRIPNNSIQSTCDIYLRNEPIKPDTVWIHAMEYIILPPGSNPVVLLYTVFISERVNLNEMKV